MRPVTEGPVASQEAPPLTGWVTGRRTTGSVYDRRWGQAHGSPSVTFSRIDKPTLDSGEYRFVRYLQ